MAWFWLEDGTPLHYIERGRGRPLVLIHALMFSARYFWKPQIHALADGGCRVLALDGVRANRSGLKDFIANGFAVLPHADTLEEMYAETFLTPTDAVADLCDDMVRQDLRAQLPTIPVPTLYMYATKHNKIRPTPIGRWMRAQTPGSKLV